MIPAALFVIHRGSLEHENNIAKFPSKEKKSILKFLIFAFQKKVSYLLDLTYIRPVHMSFKIWIAGKNTTSWNIIVKKILSKFPGCLD
jgi:hypothetical protein